MRREKAFEKATNEYDSLPEIVDWNKQVLRAFENNTEIPLSPITLDDYLKEKRVTVEYGEYSLLEQELNK